MPRDRRQRRGSRHTLGVQCPGRASRSGTFLSCVSWCFLEVAFGHQHNIAPVIGVNLSLKGQSVGEQILHHVVVFWRIFCGLLILRRAQHAVDAVHLVERLPMFTKRRYFLLCFLAEDDERLLKSASAVYAPDVRFILRRIRRVASGELAFYIVREIGLERRLADRYVATHRSVAADQPVERHMRLVCNSREQFGARRGSVIAPFGYVRRSNTEASGECCARSATLFRNERDESLTERGAAGPFA